MNQYDTEELLRKFEEFLSENLIQGTPDTLYEPIRYIQALGGKRIRPLFVLMGYNLWKEDLAPALKAGMALEYFHNFTLMHDDIMDEAKLRRGKESVHVKYGRNAAILSGDAMMIQSFLLMTELDEKYNPAISLTAMLALAALEICEGQQMDMDFETGECPSDSEYLEMIRKKTACLLGVCLRIGALLAGASPKEAEVLYSFGENIGISFQIRDDLLDTFGEASVTGKQPGGDIHRGKKNFLYVKTYSSLPDAEKADFKDDYSQATDSNAVETIISKYRSTNIEAIASGLELGYFQNAISSLDELNHLDTSVLRSFASGLLQRDR